MALTAGTRLGAYEVLNPLGSGGMGEVYRARDTRLGREVALKVLPGLFAEDPDRLARFEREAHVLASLNHPHIAQIYGVEDSGRARAIVMELVEGPTLAERLAQIRAPAVRRSSPSGAAGGREPWHGADAARHGLPLEEAFDIAHQIAEGLEAAHERGIVHRDLKPANVKLTPEGAVKVLDFGLAKALDPQPAASDEARDSPTITARATELGVLLGTAAYMAPEQIKGRGVDRRADIWAFGLVLFEMLAGRRPFAGEDVSDVLADILKSEPAWDALPADTPAGVRRLLRRCLQKDPRRRLQHIGDARLELEETREPLEEPRVAGRERAGRERRSAAIAWSVAGVAVVLAAVALAAFVWSQSFGPRPEQMRFSAVTNFAGAEAQPSLSPDGRSVAFVSKRDGQWDIYVGLVSGGTLVRITNDASLETWPRWSPDGTQIVFGRLNEAGLHDLWVVPALGGTARLVLPNAFQPSWSPDGRWIAYSSGGAIWIADASGANPRPVTVAEPSRYADYHPAFSRDGRRLAAVRRRAAGLGGPYSALIVTDVDGGTVEYLSHDDALALSPVWSPDDRFIYFAWSRGGALNVWKIPSRGGDAEQITVGQGDDAEIDLSADGTRLVFSTFRVNVNLAEMSLERETVGRLTWLTADSARGENRPAYSPDGRRIAFFSNRFGAERESIWVIDADGGNPTRLVEQDGRVSVFPRWSADGRELLFVSRAASATPLASLAETGELRRVAVAGGAPQSLPLRPWSPGWGDVTADGRIIYRTGLAQGEIYDMRTGRRQPVDDLRGDPLWSRDGRSFAFIVRSAPGQETQPGLYVETAGGGRRRLFTGWVLNFTWTASGDLLILEGKPHLQGVLWRAGAAGERREIVVDAVPLFLAHTSVELTLGRFDVHPDGRRIVTEAVESFEADIGMITNVR